MNKPIADPTEEQVPTESGRTSSRRNLRHVAEERVARHPAPSHDLEGRSHEQIVHELEVHQIELEIQNEALREAQHALEESRDRYADLYDFAPVGYLTLTKKAEIIEANLTAATLLGTERDKLIKKRIRKFIASKDLERWDRYFTTALHNHEKQIFTLRLKKGDGSVICARLESIRLDRASGEPVVRTAISDITDRMKTEEKLARRNQDLDELNAAYKTIASGQEELRRTVDELSARESDLKEALAEKDVLLAEIHHRVKNNLTAFISLLSLEGSYDNTPAGLALKKDLQNRARSMALVHETLYRTKKYSEVDMDMYLTSLTQQIAATFSTSSRIVVLTEAHGVTLDITRATPCGIIVNELITNSFRHAFPESFDCTVSRQEPCTIRVGMQYDGDQYQLEVSDNGIGLPPEIDPMTNPSLGLKLITFLARHQLRATVTIRRDRGTEFQFRFGTRAGRSPPGPVPTL